ncbi:MAG: hypothetical protein KAI24_25745, partial [Planctomycetes bacterium]|nr:hypothetical protein [Planctomycetota bacterium]
HYRIDALRQQGDPASMRRMQADLAGLLELDPSPQTRALVAELLLDFAAQADSRERRAALGRVDEILAPVSDEFARAAVARARRLEIEGANGAAVQAMRRALEQHEGNLYVHLQAAAMFDRNDLRAESEREHALLRRMQPQGTQESASAPVDFGGLENFLGEVDRVLQTLDGGPRPNRPQPERPTGDEPAKAGDGSKPGGGRDH